MSDYLKKRVKRKRYRRNRSHQRVRNRVHGDSQRPRLAVFKSHKHTYAQIIDDFAGETLAAASSLDAEIKGQLEGSGATVEAAELIGKTLAARAKEKGVERVVFDRGGYIYHGKVKALADAAREEGLKF